MYLTKALYMYHPTPPANVFPEAREKERDVAEAIHYSPSSPTRLRTGQTIMQSWILLHETMTMHNDLPPSEKMRGRFTLFASSSASSVIVAATTAHRNP